MALLSELVATCETHRVDTGGTLSIFARRLREAGRISQAGRGRGAAHMTYLDAARFLIACAATDHPERAADAEFVFSNFVRNDEQMWTDADFPMAKDEAPTLDMALAKTLEALGTGQVDAVAIDRWKEKFPDALAPAPAYVWLILPRSGGAAELRVLDGRYHYHHPALAAVVSTVQNREGYPVQKIATDAFARETHRFRTGKNLTAEFSGELLRAVADLIAGKDASK